MYRCACGSFGWEGLNITQLLHVMAYLNVSFNIYLDTQRKTMNTTVHLLAKI